MCLSRRKRRKLRKFCFFCGWYLIFGKLSWAVSAEAKRDGSMFSTQRNWNENWSATEETIFLLFSQSIHKSAINFSISFPLWAAQELLNGRATSRRRDDRARRKLISSFHTKVKEEGLEQGRRLSRFSSWCCSSWAFLICWFFYDFFFCFFMLQKNSVQTTWRSLSFITRWSRFCCFDFSIISYMNMSAKWKIGSSMSFLLHRMHSPCSSSPRSQYYALRACCTFPFFVFIDSINHLINWLRATIMR